jgi:hypothetical protein
VDGRRGCRCAPGASGVSDPSGLRGPGVGAPPENIGPAARTSMEDHFFQPGLLHVLYLRTNSHAHTHTNTHSTYTHTTYLFEYQQNISEP